MADKNALISINTQSSSFLFRHQGRDEGEEEREKALYDPEAAKKKPKKKKKKTNEITVNKVEDLKENLGKHLQQLNKLFGKKTIQQDNLFSEGEEESSDDDGDALAKQIAALKKLIDSNSALLKGEAGPESVMLDTDEIEVDQAVIGKIENEDPEIAKMKIEQKREEARQEQKIEQQNWISDQNKKFEEAAEEKN